MFHRKNNVCYLFFLFLFLLMACNPGSKQKEIKKVTDPLSMDAVVQQQLRQALLPATGKDESQLDSLPLYARELLHTVYQSHDYMPVWSSMEKWKPYAGDLVRYIDRSIEDGLFKEDYHYATLSELKKMLDADSLKRMDAALWTKAELLFMDAFLHLLQDLKQGRLQPDSANWCNNPEKHQSFFNDHLQRLVKAEPLDSILHAVQPSVKGYWALKAGIRGFTDSMDTRTYTYVPYPYKAGDKMDSVSFVKKLLLRLAESGIIEEGLSPDSVELAGIIRKYQQRKKIVADGKITLSLVKRLNMTDVEKYKRIAITLDRYKQLPMPMPEKYILVNLPGFYLQVWDTDTIVLDSKIICGKPATSTPFITSAISDLVIYPTWTVPSSIIKKEMLPGLKKNAGYLARKGLNLYNNNGEPVDPYSVNWQKYSKGIPYKIQQGSGDDNALGVIKFNFDNPFSVYLHDTNQRYLFSKSMRALSHGCVRVKEWEKLAFYLVRNDSLRVSPTDTLKYNSDSVTTWIAQKQKHRIGLKFKIPLFIRYFGCEGIDGKIRFYDDIYDEDKKARDYFFARK